MAVSPITEIIADIRAGKMVILVDDEDRENEGDLTMAAQFVTPEAVNFMAMHGRGLICLTLTEEHIHRLHHGTRMPVSVQSERMRDPSEVPLDHAPRSAPRSAGCTGSNPRRSRCSRRRSRARPAAGRRPSSRRSTPGLI